MRQHSLIEKTRLRALSVTAAALLVLSAAACSGSDSTDEAAHGSGTGSQTTTGEHSGATTNGNETGPEEVSAADFDRSLFDDGSATLDNKWVAFKTGKRFTWRGWTEEDGERVSHRDVFTVTDLTKVIRGVRARIGWDRDFSEGRLVETELIFLAEDKDGNVWHLGQYSETWEEGEFVGGQAWLAGYLKGAKAGIYIKGEPRLGTPEYSQGFAPPPFFWDDHGKVLKVGQKTCVPLDCFDDVLVIDEFEPRKPGAHQLKYYAPGVGNVRVGWSGNDADKEVLVLTKTEQLAPSAMAKARAEALKLETRASLYGRTPPAEQRPAE
ncbi:MAG: hypothetical protein M3304_01085 [Actinomycetota bacterium]|nr:hypothetical protein [Actinomycetota bacterium]